MEAMGEVEASEMMGEMHWMRVGADCSTARSGAKSGWVDRGLRRGRRAGCGLANS